MGEDGEPWIQALPQVIALGSNPTLSTFWLCLLWVGHSLSLSLSFLKYVPFTKKLLVHMTLRLTVYPVFYMTTPSASRRGSKPGVNFGDESPYNGILFPGLRGPQEGLCPGSSLGFLKSQLP